MKKLTIDVAGMHCKSCELLLEKSIRDVENVEKVRADQHAWTVEVSYDSLPPDEKSIESIIRVNGYKLGKEEVLPWFYVDAKKYTETILIALGLFALYKIVQASGFSFGPLGDFGSPPLGVALLVGLAAGVSSCMALVGGLILAFSAEWNESHANASRWQRFEPHLFFHFGRIVGFGVLGGLLGVFGAFVSLSPFAIGILTVVTGLVMLSLGVKLADLSPRLSRVSITLPKFLAPRMKGGGWKSEGFFADGKHHIAALSSGALTFFLPCGFTLAMQAVAITTGDFTAGALTMMAFALGTAPGLLGVGGLTSYLSGANAKRFFKFTGVLVLLLATFNISNGYNLMRLGSATVPVVPATGPVSDEAQEIRMTEGDNGYSPNVFHIKPNTKTRWIITANNPYSCASQLVAPAIGVQKQLRSGENVIEFVSPASGTIPFSCSMGMYTGKIIVDGTGAPISSIETSANIPSSSGRGYSCPMMRRNIQQ